MKFCFFISCILTASLFLSCGTKAFNGMENNKEYKIWDHVHITPVTGAESDIIFRDYDDLKNMPIAVKALVARFAAYSPSYIWNEEMKQELAQVLGDYPSLEEAQKSLLEIGGKDYVPDQNPVTLTIKRSNNILVFKYRFVFGLDIVVDKFKISRNGELKWISRQSER